MRFEKNRRHAQGVPPDVGRREGKVCDLSPFEITSDDVRQDTRLIAIERFCLCGRNGVDSVAHSYE